MSMTSNLFDRFQGWSFASLLVAYQRVRTGWHLIRETNCFTSRLYTLSPCCPFLRLVARVPYHGSACEQSL